MHVTEPDDVGEEEEEEEEGEGDDAPTTDEYEAEHANLGIPEKLLHESGLAAERILSFAPS